MKLADVLPGRILLSPAPQYARWRIESVSGLYAMAVNVRRGDGEVLYVPDLIEAGWRVEYQGHPSDRDREPELQLQLHDLGGEA